MTTGPPERLPLREALVLGRRRGQSARLCKRWKRQGRGDEARRPQPWRILWAVSAKLLAMLVPQGVCWVSWWACPDRSLTKAVQTVQQPALPLASVCARGQRLAAALLTVNRCLAAGCRMNRRKKHPKTSQL